MKICILMKQRLWRFPHRWDGSNPLKKRSHRGRSTFRTVRINRALPFSKAASLLPSVSATACPVLRHVNLSLCKALGKYITKSSVLCLQKFYPELPSGKQRADKKGTDFYMQNESPVSSVYQRAAGREETSPVRQPRGHLPVWWYPGYRLERLCSDPSGHQHWTAAHLFNFLSDNHQVFLFRHSHFTQSHQPILKQQISA